MFRTFVAVGGAVLLSAASLGADTLVMRDGRRLHGSLVSVGRGTVVFDQDRGYGRPRQTRLRLSEVDRIELRDAAEEEDVFTDDERARADDEPRGGEDRVVDVTAGEPWTDTGLELRAGQDLYFSPEGMVIWSAGHEDGPGGEANSPYDTRRPIPGRPAGGLIGRIGTGADTFFIGTDRGPYRVKVPGRLFLGINDDYFEDNSGRFRVTISY
ncbi:MAG: hypothetical protein DMF80_01655 [Acidobacteria bacterium]|nr:MAG: hypothetical protein DMF80_01655 [Acidobacteriota bacterium]PYQ26088.1 MAG: hypothetical protein DMF81_00510 [Acidobacteriota bacterium]